jgi:hypothetical protein
MCPQRREDTWRNTHLSLNTGERERESERRERERLIYLEGTGASARRLEV